MSHVAPASQLHSHGVTLCGETLNAPAHICAFFDTPAQKYDVLAPFIGEGIAAGDRVFNIVDAANRTAHVGALEASSVPARQAMASGHLQVLNTEDTYLGSRKTGLNGMLDLICSTRDTSRHDGRWLRGCGEMNWVSEGRVPLEHVIEYEARINYFVPTFGCTIVCVYDYRRTPLGIIADVLATHPMVIVNGVIHRNPRYVAPELLLMSMQQRAL